MQQIKYAHEVLNTLFYNRYSGINLCNFNVKNIKLTEFNSIVT